MRSIGADHVIDYTRDDFTRSGQRYDLIIDNVGNRSLRDLRRVLAPSGTLVIVGAPKGRWILGFLARLVAAPVLSRFGDQRLMAHLTETRNEDLVAMSELVEAGKVRPVIDRCYPMSRGPRRDPLPRDAPGEGQGRHHDLSRHATRVVIIPLYESAFAMGMSVDLTAEAFARTSSASVTGMRMARPVRAGQDV